MKERYKKIRDKEFVPAVLLGLLILSITWGARYAGGGSGVESGPAHASGPSAALPTKTPNLNIMKVAHRGVKALAPENTLPAFQKAIDMGYSYVELDVQYSRDGVPVVMHDAAMSRTTNRTDIISFVPLSKIKKADAGAWFGKEFAGTRVPTLEEALQLMKGRIKLYLDQKAPPRPELVELLKKYEFLPGNVIAVGGGDMVRAFEKLSPGAAVMPPLYSADSVEEQLKKYPSAKAFNTNCETLTKEMVLAAHARGVMIFTNALEIPPEKERECMRRAIEAGADALQFDHPDVFEPLIEEMKKEQSQKR